MAVVTATVADKVMAAIMVTGTLVTMVISKIAVRITQGNLIRALKAAVNYWFENTDGGWLTCCHAKENPASGRVMEKAGFLYHHDAIDHKFDGTPVECRSYLLTRERYNRKDLL